MNSKSPEAFRTISEVSKDLSLPQHAVLGNKIYKSNQLKEEVEEDIIDLKM